jgi:preprotein translocase subunit YajC
MEMLLPLALVVGVMWLMTSRNRKQQRQAADFRANLEIGQEVMTGSGLYGTIVDVDGDTITLESTPGNHTRWIRAAIAKLVPPVEPADDDLVDDAADDTAYVDDDDTLTADGDAHRAVQDYGTTPRVDRIDVPDDLSSLDERRRPGDGTESR